MNKVRLGDMLTFQRGYDLTHNQMKGGKIPVVGSSEIIGWHDEAKVKAPVLLIGRSGTVGRPQYYETDIWPHNTTLFISDYHDNNPKFCFYFLKNLNLEDYANSSGVPTLNRNFIHPLIVNFPNLKTQTAIARALSSLDNKIELNSKINKELENLAKTIYEYWFAQNADEKWEKGKLSEIANITMGQSPDGNSYNKKGDGIVFYQGCTDFGTRFPTIRQYTTAPTRFANVGDILLSVRAPVGSLNFANTKCCIGRGLAALNSKIGSITHLYFILKDLELVFKRRNTDGTTFGAITKDDLFSLSVIKPPKEIIMNFEEIAKPIFDKQLEIAEESANLAQLRDFLLPLLMNGQVTVGKA